MQVGTSADDQHGQGLDCDPVPQQPTSRPTPPRKTTPAALADSQTIVPQVSGFIVLVEIYEQTHFAKPSSQGTSSLRPLIKTTTKDTVQHSLRSSALIPDEALVDEDADGETDRGSVMSFAVAVESSTIVRTCSSVPSNFLLNKCSSHRIRPRWPRQRRACIVAVPLPTGAQRDLRCGRRPK